MYNRNACVTFQGKESYDEPVASVRRVGYRHQAVPAPKPREAAKIAILTVFDFNATTFWANSLESKPLKRYTIQFIFGSRKLTLNENLMESLEFSQTGFQNWQCHYTFLPCACNQGYVEKDIRIHQLVRAIDSTRLACASHCHHLSRSQI